jgi:hypothetical protein
MLTFGFYNAINHDRLYNALQLSSIFDGIIMDGVFMSIGNNLVVQPSSPASLNVVVGTGKAWFNHTWTNNDALLVLGLDAADMVHPRIDAIVLEVNADNAVRANSIKIIKGTAAVTPVRPTLTNNEVTHQYPLCYISVATNTSAITVANITNMVGTASCPFVTGPLRTVDASVLLAQWDAQYTAWLATQEGEYQSFLSERQSEFSDWFADLHTILDGDVGGHLQNEIDDIQANLTVLENFSLRTNIMMYVDLLHGTDGNDITFDQRVMGYPWRTIQKAIDFACRLNTNRNDISISVSNGPCTVGVVLRSIMGGGRISIVGDESNPGNMVIAPTSDLNCISTDGVGTGEYFISGFKLQTALTGGCGILVQNHFIVRINHMDFGSFLGGYHMKVSYGGLLTARDGAVYKVSGPCNVHIGLFDTGIFDTRNSAVTLSVNPTNIGVWISVGGGYAYIFGMTFTNKGYMTGQRYNAILNGVINTLGAGINYLPGNAAGYTGSGGQYV